MVFNINYPLKVLSCPVFRQFWIAAPTNFIQTVTPLTVPWCSSLWWTLFKTLKKHKVTQGLPPLPTKHSFFRLPFPTSLVYDSKDYLKANIVCHFSETFLNKLCHIFPPKPLLSKSKLKYIQIFSILRNIFLFSHILFHHHLSSFCFLISCF